MHKYIYIYTHTYKHTYIDTLQTCLLTASVLAFALYACVQKYAASAPLEPAPSTTQAFRVAKLESPKKKTKPLANISVFLF